MTEYCLTLLCVPALEEKLLDLLLMSNISVFTSTPTAEHGLNTRPLEPMEQVLGRAKAIQIQVFVTEMQKNVLLQSLHQECAGTGLRYWVTSLQSSGVIQ